MLDIFSKKTGRDPFEMCYSVPILGPPPFELVGINLDGCTERKESRVVSLKFQQQFDRGGTEQ